MKGNLSPSAYIRDRYGNKWPLKVGRIEDDFFFLKGWAKFVKDSNVELGDFLVFQYDGNCVYDVILLGNSACEKKGAAALRVKGEVEESKGVEEEEEEQMEKTYEVKEEWEDEGEANKVGKEEEEEVEEEEEETNEDRQEEEMEESYSDATEMHEDSDYQMEEEDDSTQIEEEEEEDADEEPAAKTDLKDAIEDSNSSYRGLKNIKRGKHDVKGDHRTRRHVEGLKVMKGGNHKAKAAKGKRRSRGHVDPYGYDLFKSGCIPQPKNPYFLTKLRARRKDELYVPVDVVRDHNLTLPQEIILVDQQGREWTATLNHWKDGRFWYYGGWASLCRVNIVRYEDTCICEFKRRVDGGLYIEVQIIRPQPQD